MNTLTPSSKRICANAALVLAGGLIFAACKPAPPPPPSTPPPAIQTFETKKVETAIAAYKSSPSETTKSEVDLALADMESEIKELEVRSTKVSGAEKTENDQKLSDLKDKYNRYRMDYTGARAEVETKSAGEATKDALEKVGDSAERAVEKTGDAIKDAADKVGDALTPDKKD